MVMVRSHFLDSYFAGFFYPIKLKINAEFGSVSTFYFEVKREKAAGIRILTYMYLFPSALIVSHSTGILVCHERVLRA
jgi:hypothetical protein